MKYAVYVVIVEDTSEGFEALVEVAGALENLVMEVEYGHAEQLLADIVAEHRPW